MYLTPKSQRCNNNRDVDCLPECPPSPKPRYAKISSTETEPLREVALPSFPVICGRKGASQLDSDLDGFFLVAPSKAHIALKSRGHLTRSLTPRFDLFHDDDVSENSNDSIAGAIRRSGTFQLQPRYTMKWYRNFRREYSEMIIFVSYMKWSIIAHRLHRMLVVFYFFGKSTIMM